MKLNLGNVLKIYSGDLGEPEHEGQPVQVPAPAHQPLREEPTPNFAPEKEPNFVPEPEKVPA